MRIKKLTIHNIASIGDAEIDFQNGALNDTSIFLISGETGAGKSTILDAMCLALFDQTPRMTDSSKEKIQNLDNSRGTYFTTDNSQLLRRGTGEGFVALVFEGNDGNEYEAVWAVQRDHKKPHKKLQKPTRSLRSLDNSYTENHKREIEEKISELLGMGYSQFCRTVLLAQGEFTKFLKSGKNEKSQILEKLTGTEIYSEIGKEIFERYKAIKSKWEKSKIDLEGIKLLSEEDRAEMLASSRNLEINVEEEKKNIGKIDIRIQWLKNQKDLKEKSEEAEKNIKKIEDSISSESFLDDEKRVADFFATSVPRRLYKDIAALTPEIEVMKSKLKNIQEKIRDYKEKETEKSEELRKVTEKSGKLSEEIESLKIEEINREKDSLNSRKSKLSALKGAISTLDYLLAHNKELKNEIKSKSDREKELNESIKDNIQSLEILKKEMDVKRKRYEQIFISTTDAARTLREALNEGDVCPVCGQKVNEKIDNAMFDNILSPLKEEKDKAEKAYNEMLTQSQTTKKLIEEISKDISSLETKINSADESIKNKNAEIARLKNDKEISIKDSLFIEATIEEMIQNTDERLSELDKIQKKHLELTKDEKKLRKEETDFNSQLQKLQEETRKVYDKQTELSVLVKEKEKSLETYQKEYTDFLEQNTEITEETIRTLSNVSETTINLLKERITSTRETLTKEKGRRDGIVKDIAALEENRPEMGENDSIESQTSHKEKIEKRINESNIEIGILREKLKNDDETKIRYLKILKEYNETEKEKERWEYLNKHLGDSEGSKFRSVAQSYILKSLLDNANVYLSHFNDRYKLTCQPGSLIILVEDSYRPSEPQAANILSGGESFMASLSLALALANLKGGMGVDIIFIDEGFGTLSPRYLENVMDTLEKLHRIGGRKVGLISHVPELKERIPVQIQVTRESPALSSVTIVDNE